MPKIDLSQICHITCHGMRSKSALQGGWETVLFLNASGFSIAYSYTVFHFLCWTLFGCGACAPCLEPDRFAADAAAQGTGAVVCPYAQSQRKSSPTLQVQKPAPQRGAVPAGARV